MKYRYVVVEGPIGSGKSTLARLLSERYDADLILEDPNANPFLPLFYRDMKRHALATQMFFLFQRVNQLSAGELNFSPVLALKASLRWQIAW